MFLRITDGRISNYRLQQNRSHHRLDSPLTAASLQWLSITSDGCGDKLYRQCIPDWLSPFNTFESGRCQRARKMTFAQWSPLHFTNALLYLSRCAAADQGYAIYQMIASNTVRNKISRNSTESNGAKLLFSDFVRFVLLKNDRRILFFF